ncbi:response regulator [Campylobacter corcagiensis]|uniref:Response regulator n=1 Tax=Campylobacter corcagiensis TaxID=1448857 RepID=A0A7M1LG60_9BACT|nr:response regulator [Campylobacter corcagiensis]QKF64394.1 response regulator receiver domain-containing protein [Campylobacter corcagiensis]QOQ87420.1 response regulator [Campylobacter corcagiensis]
MTLLLDNVDKDFLDVLEALVKLKKDIKLRDISELKKKKINNLPKKTKEIKKEVEIPTTEKITKEDGIKKPSTKSSHIFEIQNLKNNKLDIEDVVLKMDGDTIISLNDEPNINFSDEQKKIPPKEDTKSDQNLSNFQKPKDDLVEVEISTETKELTKIYTTEYKEVMRRVTEYVEEEVTEIIPTNPNEEENIVFNNVKIMVVEDNPINQKLMKHILTDPGIELTIVENGELAIQQRREKNFDLIFMDIAMPVMDGIEATRQIKAYERQNKLKAIPIIAVTANALKGDRERFMSQGLDEYCTKPVKKTTIYQMLKIFLPKELKGKKQKTKTIIKQVPKTLLKTFKEPTKVLKNIVKKEPVKFRKMVNKNSLINGEFVNYKDILICKDSGVENNFYKDTLQNVSQKIDTAQNSLEIENLLQNNLYRVIITGLTQAKIFKKVIKNTNPIAKVVVISDNPKDVDLDGVEVIDIKTSDTDILKFVKKYIF